MPAIGDDDRTGPEHCRRIVGKELLLAVGDVARQRSPGGRRQGRGGMLVAIAATHAETQALERPDSRSLPRLQEKPPGEFLVILEIEVGRVAKIAHPVKDAGRVSYPATKNFAVQLRAEVPVRHERRGQAALVKGQVAIGLQLLEANRRLELPDAQLQFRPIAVIQIRIKDLDRTSGEIRHEKEVEVTIDRSFKTRPGAAEEKPVVSDNPVIVEKGAAVGLKDAPKLDHEIGVRRTEAQSRGACQDHRSVFGRRGGGLLVEFTFALEGFDLLVEVFDLFLQRLDAVSGVVSADMLAGSVSGEDRGRDYPMFELHGSFLVWVTDWSAGCTTLRW